jgi:hypothetical protein
MWPDIMTPGYIDPNTSQHVFNLLGPILAFLGAAGGLVVAGTVLVRRHISSYYAKASWTKRVATAFGGIGVLAVLAAVVWWLLC